MQQIKLLIRSNKGKFYNEWRISLGIPVMIAAYDMNVKQSMVTSFERGSLKSPSKFEPLYQNYLQTNVYTYNQDFMDIEGLAMDAMSVLSILNNKHELLYGICSTFVGYNEAQGIQ